MVTERIVQKLKGNRFLKTDAEDTKIIQDAHIEDVAALHVDILSPRTIARFEIKNGIKSGKSEQVTTAGAIACADRRNTIDTTVAHSFMMPRI